jgi:putative chitinase
VWARGGEVTLTSAALRAAGASQARAEEILEPLQASCALYDITTPAREAAFLAQLGHESGGFRYTSEVWGPTDAQQRYEGRADLGNTEPGDGSRFRGHGFIQTTGRANHARVRDRLRERLSIDVPDFEAEPERLCELQWACLSAADYWDMRGLNALADAGEFDRISKAINLGNPNSSRVPNGQADRVARWERVKQALGTAAPQELPLVHLEQADDVLPAPYVSTPQEDPSMAPFIAAALPALISAVPELARMFSSGSATSERNIKAAEVVMSVAKEAIGARNEQELVDTLQRDPEAANQVRQAVKDNWYRLEEVGGGIQAARAANAQAQGDKPLHHNPAVWISAALLLFPLMLMVDVFYIHPDSYDGNLRTQIITAVLAVIMMVGGYWLGTSAGSQKKTDLLAK